MAWRLLLRFNLWYLANRVRVRLDPILNPPEPRRIPAKNGGLAFCGYAS